MMEYSDAATRSHRINLLKKTQVAEKVGLHPETIARLSREGRFPPPIRFGASMQHGVRWVEAEVEAWIAEKVAERDASLRDQDRQGEDQ